MIRKFRDTFNRKQIEYTLEDGRLFKMINPNIHWMLVTKVLITVYYFFDIEGKFLNTGILVGNQMLLIPESTVVEVGTERNLSVGETNNVKWTILTDPLELVINQRDDISHEDALSAVMPILVERKMRIVNYQGPSMRFIGATMTNLCWSWIMERDNSSSNVAGENTR